MSISLTSDLEQLIRAKVESGLYPSEAEVIRDALRALDERDQDEAAKLEALRRDIQVGLDQIDRGEVAPLDMDVIRSEVKARRANRLASG
jgi:antitoxin ParD1/3/4